VVKLPQVSGKDLPKMLTRDFGYYIRDQRGSHVHLRHPSRPPLTVPLHASLDRGTLLAILKAAGIERSEFLRKL
jgi:predicted RNA binding protein YcfA (HicA-like mRNA interferase family)